MYQARKTKIITDSYYKFFKTRKKNLNSSLPLMQAAGKKFLHFAC